MAKAQICASFIAAAVLIFAAAASADDDGNAVVLTEANFDAEVGQDRGALVEFYAPWSDSEIPSFSIRFLVFRACNGRNLGDLLLGRGGFWLWSALDG